MTSGGWQQRPGQQQHGRHRRGSSGSAWTPSVRPREGGYTPAHARPDPVPGHVRPGLTPAQPTWPTTGLDARRPAPAAESEPLWSDAEIPAPALPADLEPAWPDPAPAPTHAAGIRPAWPHPAAPTSAHEASIEPAWPDPAPATARTADETAWSTPEESTWPDPAPAHAADIRPAWPDPIAPASAQATGLGATWSDLGAPAHARRVDTGAAWSDSPSEEAEDDWDLGAPPLSSVPTAPLSLTRVREERERLRRDQPVVHALPPETPPSGLRKFDLGTVPASVTPPRTWRKAAWFAVGTSAAVMVGLAYAAVEFVGKPGEPLIDALPAYPTRAWTLEPLPADQSTNPPDRPVSSHSGPRTSSSAHNPDTATGDSPAATTGSRPTTRPGGSTSRPTSTAPTSPSRTTLGPAAVTPTNPEAMGDVTEAYYAKVTEDPEAAHELTTGGMAREGADAIEARYAGVERVEVQEITIDPNESTTTSTVKLVHEDGTETIEQRELTFTWGGDPKITAEATTA